jgi:hypothetical protein
MIETILLKAATSGSGTVEAFPVAKQLTFYVIWSPGVTAGQVVIETADDANYSGTWAGPLGTASAGSDKTDIVQLNGIFRFVRARISTPVAGGNVTVKVYGL